MRKIFLKFALILIIPLMFLCSCSKNEQTPIENNQPSIEIQTPPSKEIEIPSENTQQPPDDQASNIEYCSVSFQYNSSEYNETVNVIKGEKISNPKLSCENGYFIEWFTNEECTESYNFYNTVENSFILYGKKFKELSESFFAYENYTPDETIDSEEELINYAEYINFNGIKDENFYEVTYSDFDCSIDAITNLIANRVTMPIVAHGIETKTEDGKNYIYISAVKQIPDNLETYVVEDKPEQIYAVEFAELDNFVSQRDENFDDFKYNNLQKTVEVKSTLQLFYALEHRVKPIPQKDSPAEKALNQCKVILRKICDDSLSDLEKARHIYMYLVKNVNYISPEYSDEYSKLTEWSVYDAYQAEGILNNGAGVCDGICKTLSILMNMEGIRCVRAKNDDISHAWNEAFINGKWYTIDATFGNYTYNENGTKECLVFYSFMTNEEIEKNIWNITETMRTEIVADGVYNYYKNTYYSYNGNCYDYYIESEEELRYLFSYAMEVAKKQNVTTFSVNFIIRYNPEEGFSDMMKNAKAQAGVEGSILVTQLSSTANDEMNLLVVFE